MKILYAAKPVNHNDFDRDVEFANPDFFEGVKSRASEVAIIGDYPNIVEAYKAVKIKVEVVSNKPKQKAKVK